LTSLLRSLAAGEIDCTVRKKGADGKSRQVRSVSAYRMQHDTAGPATGGLHPVRRRLPRPAGAEGPFMTEGEVLRPRWVFLRGRSAHRTRVPVAPYTQGLRAGHTGRQFKRGRLSLQTRLPFAPDGGERPGPQAVRNTLRASHRHLQISHRLLTQSGNGPVPCPGRTGNVPGDTGKIFLPPPGTKNRDSSQVCGLLFIGTRRKSAPAGGLSF